MRKSLFRLTFARLLRVTESPNPRNLDFLPGASNATIKSRRLSHRQSCPNISTFKLIPAREMLYVAVSLVLGDKPVELAAFRYETNCKKRMMDYA